MIGRYVLGRWYLDIVALCIQGFDSLQHPKQGGGELRVLWASLLDTAARNYLHKKATAALPSKE